MEVKILEVRDTATFVPVFAYKLSPNDDKSRFLLARAGYGRRIHDQAGFVIMAVATDPQRCSYKSNSWGDRTFETAHRYIEENFDALENGDVVDVRYILGETELPIISEYYSKMGYLGE